MNTFLLRVWPWSEITRLKYERDALERKLSGLIDMLKQEGHHTFIEGEGATLTNVQIFGHLGVLGDHSAVIGCYVELGSPAPRLN